MSKGGGGRSDSADRFDAFEPDEKIMWNARVHAGVIARFARLSAESGLTMADLLTIAVVEVERSDELRALIRVRKGSSSAISQERGIKEVLDREKKKMRERRRAS